MNTVSSFDLCYTRCGQAGDHLEKGRQKDCKAQCEERLSELVLFSLKKKRLNRDLSTMVKYLKDGYRKDRDPIFPRNHMEKMRGKGLRQGTFQ